MYLPVRQTSGTLHVEIKDAIKQLLSHTSLQHAAR
jgi:hypothetical protein